MTSSYSDAADSICPKGWKMPYYETSYNHDVIDSWENLLSATYGVTNNVYGANRTRKWPLNFEPAGTYVNYVYYNDVGFVTYRTTSGYWWSMTGGGTTSKAHMFTSSSSGVFPATSYEDRGWGLAIRCVVRS